MNWTDVITSTSHSLLPASLSDQHSGFCQILHAQLFVIAKGQLWWLLGINKLCAVPRKRPAFHFLLPQLANYILQDAFLLHQRGAGILPRDVLNLKQIAGNLGIEAK